MIDKAILKKAVKSAQSLSDFDEKVIESISILKWSWVELGFDENDPDEGFFSYILEWLEFLPIKDESLYGEGFLKELKQKEQKFKEEYKDRVQVIGRRLLEKLKGMLDSVEE